MLEHGGRLRRAAERYRIPLADWLDLSTGISPFGWPPPLLPAEVWQRLPEDDDGLVEVARGYYGAPHLLPVAGSQAAIQALPRLRAPGRVGVIAPGYAEHAQAWRRAGHEVARLSAAQLFEAAERLDVVVLIHPNNPGAERFQRGDLLGLHARLASRGGWLVVDEAFIDATPERSLCGDSDREGLVVLRSIGKFFGLAGARAGFACASAGLLDALRERLGPWALSGPTRHVLMQALADRDWQAAARTRLIRAGTQLGESLDRCGLSEGAGCAYFQWRRHPQATRLHDALARRGILVRCFDSDEATPPSLRFGLPADAAARQRLERGLHEALSEMSGREVAG